jgi:nucleotide-binding universal stress UspA family protein
VLNIKNILFPTDFSRCAVQALEHALFLAKYCRARLHIIHVIVLHQDDPHNPAYHFPDLKELHKKLGDMARESMGSNLRASKENNEEISIITKELRGFTAADVILQYADAEDIDLIVMGTHGRRGLDYLFLGSVAREVVREASCPVYTIRESETAKFPSEIDTILSPVDFSDHSGTAVSIAREAAKLYNAKLQLLHVIEENIHPAFYDAGQEAVWRLKADIAGQSQSVMKRIFTESPGPDVKTEFKVVSGHIVHEILEYTKNNGIDLIVIATHGLSGLKHFLLGSVAEKVIHRARCPVLTVKAFGKTPF